MLYASESSFGTGFAISRVNKTVNYYVSALYETQSGYLVDNIYPVGGKSASTTKSPATTTANPSSVTIAPDCLSEFRTAGLNQHNTLRAKHGAKAMKSSSAVENSALDYAKTLASTGGNLVHSKTSYGENLWYSIDSSNLSLAKCKRNFFILSKFL